MISISNLRWVIVNNDKNIADFIFIIGYHFGEAAINTAQLIERNVLCGATFGIGEISKNIDLLVIKHYICCYFLEITA